MASLSNCSFSRASYLCSPTLKPHRPINSLPCTNFFKPFSSSSSYPSFSLPRQKVSRKELVLQKLSYRLVVVSGLDSGTYPEAEPIGSTKGAAINTKLPRRSLLVQFTCNECGERSQRLINRLAYERGLVYVQCAGCERYHKLADNLGLIIEYNLLEDITAESNTDPV